MRLQTDIDLVLVPAGTFLMGENDEDKFANDTERPRHRGHVSAFELGRDPVTIGQYRAFRPDHEPGLPEDWPVASVSWEDAQVYCQWLGEGYRLPTETEWEYAARGGTQTPYPHGKVLDTTQANFYYNERGNRVGPGHRTPVGMYPKNRYGLHDMCGNVCEWVQDIWQPMYWEPMTDFPLAGATTTQQRVLRGGAWDYLPRLLRVSWRDSLPQTTRRDNVGFRIARDVT